MDSMAPRSKSWVSTSFLIRPRSNSSHMGVVIPPRPRPIWIPRSSMIFPRETVEAMEAPPTPV